MSCLIWKTRSTKQSSQLSRMPPAKIKSQVWPLPSNKQSRLNSSYTYSRFVDSTKDYFFSINCILYFMFCMSNKLRRIYRTVNLQQNQLVGEFRVYYRVFLISLSSLVNLILKIIILTSNKDFKPLKPIYITSDVIPCQIHKL